MKHIKVMLSLGAALACAGFAGCSKSRNATTGTAPISTDSAGPVTMKMKWTVGKSYDQEMSMNQEIHLDAPVVPKPTDQTMVMTQDYSISALKALPDGGTTLQLQITGQKMESKLGAKVQVNFDSSRDPSEDGHDPAAPLLRKMIGPQLKYDVDENGKVGEITGLPEFVKEISGGDPKAKALIGSYMSEGTLKQMVSRGEGLPPGPVQVGDHWPVHLEVETGQAGIILLDMKYTFKGWQQREGRKCALNEFVGDMTTKPGSSSGPMNVSIDKGTVEGTTWFDPDMGTVVETSIIENMKLQITIQGKAVNLPMKQTVIVKLAGINDITN